jgi:hypothetical protein
MEDNKRKEPGLMADELVSIRPTAKDIALDKIQICFPPELGLKNRNVWGEVIEEKYHVMKVKEWLKNKKNMFTIEEGVLTPMPTSPSIDGMISRYSQKQVNPGFYGTIKIEVKSAD